MILKVRRSLNSGDIDGFMTALQSLVAQIPYHEMDMPNLEKTYHLVIYELFLIIGVNSRSEVAMSGGRIDMVVETFDFVYVIEFKLGGSVEEALAQIDDRGYAIPWRADGRKVFKIGVVFSPDTRTISHWEVREYLLKLKSRSVAKLWLFHFLFADICITIRHILSHIVRQ